MGFTHTTVKRGGFFGGPCFSRSLVQSVEISPLTRIRAVEFYPSLMTLDLKPVVGERGKEKRNALHFSLPFSSLFFQR